MERAEELARTGDGASEDEVRAPRRFGVSLRVRVTLWIFVIATAIHLVFGGLVLLYQRASVNKFFNSRLERAHQRVMPEIEGARFDVDDETLTRIAGRLFVLPEASLIAIYRVSDGRVVRTLPGVPTVEEVQSWVADATGPQFLRKELRVEAAEDDDHVWRVLVERRTDREGNKFLVLAAGSDSYAESMMSVVSSVLLLTIPAGIAVALGCGWTVGGLATQPLSRLGELAGSLTPERLNLPIAGTSQVPEVAVLQEGLEETRRRLRDAMAAQERFISNVSHELRTPVSVLLTEAQTLSRAGMDATQSGFMDSVTDEMRRLGRMVESFLTLTKLRGGEGPVNVSRCDLNEIVMHSIEGCGRMAEKQGCVIAARLQEENPPEIAGDEDLLRIMLDNILRNAIRFSPPGGRVDVWVGEDSRGRCVRVIDQGPGISDELLGRLFDRFAQASEEAQHGRGYGLGLSIAQGIAELHGGKIEAENLAAGGCEFRVCLPAAGAPRATDGEIEEPREYRGPSGG